MSTSCPRCATLDLDIAIRTPGEFAKALRVIRANLTDGTLEAIPAGDEGVRGSFSDLSEAGPWPDRVDCRFVCAGCGRRYRLRVETYHGAGGHWAREDSDA